MHIVAGGRDYQDIYIAFAFISRRVNKDFGLSKEVTVSEVSNFISGLSCKLLLSMAREWNVNKYVDKSWKVQYRYKERHIDNSGPVIAAILAMPIVYLHNR